MCSSEPSARDVTLVFSAERRRASGRDAGAERNRAHERAGGVCRFITTGDCRQFRLKASASAVPDRRGRLVGGARSRHVSRTDDRRSDALRPLKIECDFSSKPHARCSSLRSNDRPLYRLDSGRGSALADGSRRGWLTAEYSLLPAHRSRTAREASTGKQKGRTSRFSA